MINERTNLRNDLEPKDQTEASKSDSEFSTKAEDPTQVYEPYKGQNEGFKPKRFIGIILGFSLIVAIGQWVISPGSGANLDFGVFSINNEETQLTESTPIPPATPKFPEINASPISSDVEKGSYEDFISALSDAGLFDLFESYERQLLYNADLSISELISYINELQTAGLFTQLEAFEMVGFINAGITVERLKQYYSLEISGANLEFYEIIAYVKNGITPERLAQLNEQGLLPEYDFHEIIGFENNTIPSSYLSEIKEVGLQGQLEFFEIIHYFQNNVSVSFLSEMKEKGFLGELSFFEISQMFKERSN